jgi:glycyl-radical enzyme activating protein
MRIFSTGFSEGLDGPGRRWIVYLKGCNFRCLWCASPESISGSKEILFYPDRSRYSDKSCTHGAVSLDRNSFHLNRSECEFCKDHNCVTVFHDPSFEIVGEDITSDHLVGKAEKYRSLFGRDGGVTFGGGESTLQDVELFEAIAELRARQINVAVETNGSTAAAQKLVGKVDLLICDFKCFSRDLHLQWTGAENDQVLKTILYACKQNQKLLVRIPLICGFNDFKSEWSLMRDFLCDCKELAGELNVEILRMHHFGKPKYKALGIEYPMLNVACPTQVDVRELANLLKNSGINVRVCT